MSRRLKAQLWYRTLTALFGVWFVLATTDVASAHACPMHDGPMPTATSSALADGAHHHHNTGTSLGESSEQDGSHQAAHSCTCISSCCAATVPMPAAAAVVAFLETLSEPAALLSEPVVLHRVAKIDFVLPFATAPPMTRHA